MEVANFVPQTQGEAFSLILKEKYGERFLPVVIGLPEGRLVVIEQNRIAMKRPFAHDVLLQLCERTDCVLQKVVIDDYKDGIFYVHIHLLRKGEELLLDSRVSDAVVIALKARIPIFVHSSIMVAAGYTKDGRISNPQPASHTENDDEDFIFEPDEEEDDRIRLTEDMDFSQYPVNVLNDLLRQAVETENYEAAALIDAELNKRPDYAKEK